MNPESGTYMPGTLVFQYPPRDLVIRGNTQHTFEEIQYENKVSQRQKKPHQERGLMRRWERRVLVP